MAFTYYDNMTIEDTVRPMESALLDLLDIVETELGTDCPPWERLDWRRKVKAAKSAASEAARLSSWAMTPEAVRQQMADETEELDAAA